MVAWDGYPSQSLLAPSSLICKPFLSFYWPARPLFCSFEENYVGLIKYSNLLVALPSIKGRCRCSVKWQGHFCCEGYQCGWENCFVRPKRTYLGLHYSIHCDCSAPDGYNAKRLSMTITLCWTPFLLLQFTMGQLVFYWVFCWIEVRGGCRLREQI